MGGVYFKSNLIPSLRHSVIFLVKCYLQRPPLHPQTNMSNMGSIPMLSLTNTSGSFPFESKYIPLSRNSKIVLGSEIADVPEKSARDPAATNGWFAAKPPRAGSGLTPISPLPLSSSHAEVWSFGGKIYIRDLDSPFGTYVNDVKITQETALKAGDIISLGSVIARNKNTPKYITDDHLKPIIAKVALSGVPQT